MITYQGIAWGEKRAEARKAVVNAGLVKKNVTWQFAAAGGENVGQFAMVPDSYLGWDFYEGYSAGGTSDWLYPNDISGKVAGYSVSMLYLEYIFHINQGKADKKDPRLNAVMIDLVTPSVSDAMKDLNTKLTTLYGEPVRVPLTGWIWYGGERSAVMLIEFDDFVSLLYSRVDSLERLREVSGLLNPAPASNDLNGL